MNCNELHAHWESDLKGRRNTAFDAIGLADHAAVCPECNSFVEERQELARMLQALRHSAPAVPASVDRAVAQGYRRHISGQQRSSVLLTRRISPHASSAWAVAISFAIIAVFAAVLFFLSRHEITGHRVETPPMVVPQSEANVKSEIAEVEKPIRKITRSPAAAVKHRRRAATTQEDSPVPTRFQSLMYCDQLSCPDALDIIRMQLPSPVLGVTASGGSSGLVSAEILVGQDGIARGIRFVE